MVKSQHENGWSDSAGPWGQQRGQQICPVGHLQRHSQDKSLTGRESWQAGTETSQPQPRMGQKVHSKDQSKTTYAESGRTPVIPTQDVLFADLWKGAFLRRPQTEGVFRVTLTTWTHTCKVTKAQRRVNKLPCMCHLGLKGSAKWDLLSEKFTTDGPSDGAYEWPMLGFHLIR